MNSSQDLGKVFTIVTTLDAVNNITRLSRSRKSNNGCRLKKHVCMLSKVNSSVCFFSLANFRIDKVVGCNHATRNNNRFVFLKVKLLRVI